MTVAGCCGVRRWTHVLPSAKAMRTSVSVRVVSRPAMRRVCPRRRFGPHAPGLDGGGARQPCGDRGQGLDRAGEDTGSSARRISPSIGVFHSTLNSPGRSSLTSRYAGRTSWARPGSGAKKTSAQPGRRSGQDREPPHGRTSAWPAKESEPRPHGGIGHDPVLAHQAVDELRPGVLLPLPVPFLRQALADFGKGPGLRRRHLRDLDQVQPVAGLDRTRPATGGQRQDGLREGGAELVGERLLVLVGKGVAEQEAVALFLGRGTVGQSREGGAGAAVALLAPEEDLRK